MTNMPVLDKGSAAQNILSTKGTKPAQPSGGGSFDAVLKQTTAMGKQETTPMKQTETAKTSEAGAKAEDTAPKEELNKSGKTEEKAGTSEADTETKTQEVSEDITEDTEVLERAGGEMAAALAAQLGIRPEVVAEAMDKLGMTEVSLLDPKNLKELMVELTEGADEMSLLTDETFYQSVTEALGTLEDITKELQEETGMTPEQLKAAVAEAEKMFAEAPEVTEEVQETSGQMQEAEGDQNTLRFTAPKPEATENARTETTMPKETPRQESAGNDSESPFMGNSYQTSSAEQAVQVHAEEVRSAFSFADTQQIMDQILDYMKVSVKPEMTSLEMQLHPESLGTLHIQITNREGALTAQFIAQNESVRAALESQVMELKENLEQQGVKVEAVEVTVAQYSLDRNPGGNETASEQQQKQGRKGGRNLNLGELDPEEEDLTEEERLTAEIMQAEGNIVNYTA